jgi:hypothetical protein
MSVTSKSGPTYSGLVIIIANPNGEENSLLAEGPKNFLYFRFTVKTEKTYANFSVDLKSPG